MNEQISAIFLKIGMLIPKRYSSYKSFPIVSNFSYTLIVMSSQVLVLTFDVFRV